jgi:hypothetical protein
MARTKAKRKRSAKPKRDLKAKIPEILARISKGESLRSICRDPGMPDNSTFIGWVGANEELQAAYAVAMEQRADIHFEEMFEIAGDVSRDFVEVKNDAGEVVVRLPNPNGIRRAVLEVDVRKWALSRMNPKKYGDKVDLNHGGRVKVVTLDRDDEAI